MPTTVKICIFYNLIQPIIAYNLILFFQATNASSLTVYCLRVLPGQELQATILGYVKKNNLKAAFVMTCCGSVTKATLRYAQKSDGVNVRESDPSKCKHEMVGVSKFV